MKRCCRKFQKSICIMISHGKGAGQSSTCSAAKWSCPTPPVQSSRSPVHQTNGCLSSVEINQRPCCKEGKRSFQTSSSSVTTGLSWGASQVERSSYPFPVLTAIVGNGINRFPKFESCFPSLGKGGLLRCCCIFFKILVGRVGWPWRCESCLGLVSEASRDRLEIIFFCSVE